jgi:tRNA (cmo5U34)-methyltransferase
VIFAQAHAALTANGVFINADQVRGETAAIDRRCHDRWIARVRELGAPERDLMMALEQMKFDHTSTADEQLGWLREAGFREVGLAYRNLIFAVYCGTK